MKTTTTIIFFLFLAQLSFAQKEILGKWKANCPTEIKETENGQVLKYCNICIFNSLTHIEGNTVRDLYFKFFK